jgi:hypothetical protein
VILPGDLLNVAALKIIGMKRLRRTPLVRFLPRQYV